jgi:hypothetical protein
MKNHCWMTPLLHPKPWRKCQVDFYDRVNLRLCTAWWNVMSLLQAQVESWAIDVDLFAVVRDILHTDVMYYPRALSRWGMLCACFVSAPCVGWRAPYHGTLLLQSLQGIAQRVWSSCLLWTEWPQFRIMVRTQLMVVLQTVDIISADGSA